MRRRRAVRAAGYGGGAMLAVGALAVGGTRIPWESVGGGLNVGGTGCVTASPSAATGVGPVASAAVGVGVDVVGTQITFTELSTGEQVLVHIVGGGLSTDDIPSAAYDLTAFDDGTYTLDFIDGASTTFRVDGEMVTTLRVDVPTPSVAPEALPSPSADCITAEPSPSESQAPTPDPNGGTAEAPLQEVGSSPFQCGFVFPSLTGSTGVITLSEPRWHSAAAAESSVRSFFMDPESIALSMSGEDVPVVTFTSVSSWPGMNLGGVTGAEDPATGAPPGFIDDAGNEVQGGLADGAQFVLVIDDTVAATYAWDQTGTSGITQYIDSYDGGAGTLYGLNLQAGFTACAGVDPAALVGAQPVAVVGTQALQDGIVTGPYYAWQFITHG